MRLDPGFLKTLERLRLVSTRTFAGAGRGDRRSRHRGRGIEFADYRPYAQGDDVRHIDWKAYKRLNRLVLRLFDEDQDLRVYLFLDASRSMASHGKFDQALRIAAALCYVGAVHLDRVTLLPFAARLGSAIETGDGRQSILRLLESLDRLTAEGQTDLWRVACEFQERERRPGLAIVISDFLDPAGCERPLKLLSGRGHDVVALHLVARADRSSGGEVGDAVFVDAESGEQQVLDVTPGLARAYARAWDEFDAEIKAACRRSRAAHVSVGVEVPLERTVLETLRAGRVIE